MSTSQEHEAHMAEVEARHPRFGAFLRRATEKPEVREAYQAAHRASEEMSRLGARVADCDCCYVVDMVALNEMVHGYAEAVALVRSPESDNYRDEACRHVVTSPYAENRYVRLLDDLRRALGGS